MNFKVEQENRMKN